MTERTIAYLGDHIVLTKTQDNRKIYVDSRDTSVAPHLMMDGFWESWVTEFFLRILEQRTDEPGAVVVDVGANFGYYALVAHWHPDPEHYDVWAYEPNPRVADLLRRTFSVNGMKLAQCRQAAVSNRSGTARLSFHGHELGNASLREDELVRVHASVADLESVCVEVTTVRLDDEFPAGTRVAAIKMDAEGHEPQILEGAARILQENPSIDLLIEQNQGEEHHEAIAQLARDGFSIFHINANSHAVTLTQETLRDLPTGEMLYARRLDAR